MTKFTSPREPEVAHSTIPMSQLPMPLEIESESPQRMVSLSLQQEQALEWLIGGGSLGEAAQFAGVTRQTISRWLRTDDDFRAVYDAWKEEVNQMLEGRLIAAGDAAMDNLLNAVRVNRNLKASEFVLKSLMAMRKKTGE